MSQLREERIISRSRTATTIPVLLLLHVDGDKNLGGTGVFDEEGFAEEV